MKRRLVEVSNASIRGALPIRRPRDSDDTLLLDHLPNPHHALLDAQSNDADMTRFNNPDTSSGARDAQFSTPTKKVAPTPRDEYSASQRADRSARKKSIQRLAERQVSEEFMADEEALAEEILDENSEPDEDPSQHSNEDLEDQVITVATPSKRGRGRPKGSKRKRTPTPPSDMPAHEVYFFHNRPTGTKTSNNTLSSISLLSHEDYYKRIRAYTDPHIPEQDFLHTLHRLSFEQWIFELEENFNICLYGWGSKLSLLSDFATKLSINNQEPVVVIVNGYLANLTVRDVLATIIGTLPSLKGQKPGSQPSDSLALILKGLISEPSSFRLALIVHSIDSPSLRRNNTQAILGALAASSRVSMIATADNPNFPILWDASLRSQFNFLFHDVTTFQSFEKEISVVDDVNELLGRSGRRIDGREGVTYVLKSLTENARRLYALLLAEQLSTDPENVGAAEAEGHDNAEEDEEFELALNGSKQDTSRTKTGSNARIDAYGIEYRTLYRKAMGELISTNEIGFRTLLKEFYDHQMIVSKKDRMGAELLSVPFRREELEAILEDLGG